MNSFVFTVVLIATFVFSSSSCAKTPSCKAIVCPKNEVLSLTATSCQPTCFNNNTETFFLGCSAGIHCVCKKGYIRHPTTNKCIPVKSCPVKKTNMTCPVNEVFSDSGAGCQRTCYTQSLPIRIKCVAKSGCKCKDGFIRNDVNGECVPNKSCSVCPKPYSYVKTDKKCVINCNQCEGRNEEYKTCGNRCMEPGCNKDLRVIRCANLCEPGCFCKEGYARDELAGGQCVAVEDCQTCSDNEVAGYGNPMCEKTCETKDDVCNIQILRAEYKCYCADGYVRVSEDDPECIPVDEC